MHDRHSLIQNISYWPTHNWWFGHRVTEELAWTQCQSVIWHFKHWPEIKAEEPRQCHSSQPAVENPRNTCRLFDSANVRVRLTPPFLFLLQPWPFTAVRNSPAIICEIQTKTTRVPERQRCGGEKRWFILTTRRERHMKHKHILHHTQGSKRKQCKLLLWPYWEWTSQTEKITCSVWSTWMSTSLAVVTASWTFPSPWSRTGCLDTQISHINATAGCCNL